MNTIKGEITDINTHGNLSLISIRIDNTFLKSIVIETPATADYLQTGKNVQVLFKETEVIIGKNKQYDISLQNRLLCTITSIEKGKLLSKLTLRHADTVIGSVITSDAVTQLRLAEGEEVMAMIKTNEIMLSE